MLLLTAVREDNDTSQIAVFFGVKRRLDSKRPPVTKSDRGRKF
jgi:hypothetical protein